MRVVFYVSVVSHVNLFYFLSMADIIEIVSRSHGKFRDLVVILTMCKAAGQSSGSSRCIAGALWWHSCHQHL